MAELNWALPDKDSKFDQTLIYRSTSKYGVYTLIKTLTNIRVTKYFDTGGASSSFYKIRFFDSVNVIYSPYSNPIRPDSVSDTNYSTPKLVAQYLNSYRSVVGYSIGTGDGSTKKFSLPTPDNLVIDDTETVYLNGVEAIRNSDYSIDYDTGIVTFAVAPSINTLVTGDWWASTYVVNSQYIKAIRRAEDEMNRRIGRSFYQPMTITEYIDSFDPLDTSPFAYEPSTYNGMAQQFHPQTNWAMTSRVIKLEKYPIVDLHQIILNAQPVATVGESVGTGNGADLAFTLDFNPVVFGSEIVYVAGSQATNYTINYSTGVITFNSAPTGAITADYIYCTSGTVLDKSNYLTRNDAGYILLKDSLVKQIHQQVFIVAVTFDYGYYDIPPIVEDLATRLAAINLIQSTTLGAQSPLSIQASNIGVLLGEVRSLYDSIGRKMEVTRI